MSSKVRRYYAYYLNDDKENIIVEKSVFIHEDKYRENLIARLEDSGRLTKNDQIHILSEGSELYVESVCNFMEQERLINYPLGKIDVRKKILT